MRFHFELSELSSLLAIVTSARIFGEPFRGRNLGVGGSMTTTRQIFIAVPAAIVGRSSYHFERLHIILRDCSMDPPTLWLEIPVLIRTTQAARFVRFAVEF
jgi:hypothetical protein